MSLSIVKLLCVNVLNMLTYVCKHLNRSQTLMHYFHKYKGNSFEFICVQIKSVQNKVESTKYENNDNSNNITEKATLNNSIKIQTPNLKKHPVTLNFVTIYTTNTFVWVRKACGRTEHKVNLRPVSTVKIFICLVRSVFQPHYTKH